MVARRYLHDYGATSEDFGRVAVADRRHAATNPNAWFHERPITLDEHQASRWIAEPLRLLDCCQESDGAVALVVTSVERARDLPQPPAVIAAAAQGSGAGPVRDDQLLPRRPGRACRRWAWWARQLWGQSGLGPSDVRRRGAVRPLHAVRADAAGGARVLRPRARRRHFIADGALELGGALPINPHGGQLGEAYIHGMNGIAEGVRQVRGTAVNQVAGAATCWSRRAPACRPAGSS